MDKHVIIDVSYICEVLWSFGAFFFSGKSLVTVIIMIADFYISVFFLKHIYSYDAKFVAAEPAFCL